MVNRSLEAILFSLDVGYLYSPFGLLSPLLSLHNDHIGLCLRGRVGQVVGEPPLGRCGCCAQTRVVGLAQGDDVLDVGIP